jgi:sugar/nucleoside kinase (ribokinase family)
MSDLCAVGDLKWLITLLVPNFPCQGEMTRVISIERQIGNDAAIVSLLAARLGMRCRLLPTNAIAHHDGQPLIDLLQRTGVDVSLIDVGRIVTPTTFLLLQVASDERSWLVEDCPFRSNIALGNPPDYTFAYLDLYEEYLEDRLAILHKWSQANVRCIVNLSASNLEEKVRLLADVSLIDTVQMRGSDSVDEARIWGRHVLQTCNARAAVITLGHLGAVLVDKHSEYTIEAEPIEPLRTLGAGASFSAGFLYALARNESYVDAVAFASRNAADFCASIENPLETIKI